MAVNQTLSSWEAIFQFFNNIICYTLTIKSITMYWRGFGFSRFICVNHTQTDHEQIYLNNGISRLNLDH